LQDNPTLWWDTDLVAKAISGRVRRWNIDAIITFDNGGVSGHINHRAVAAGVEYSHLFVNDTDVQTPSINVVAHGAHI
jgi:N-acetylglucosaminylphosphatidylinositol deacetylase